MIIIKVTHGRGYVYSIQYYIVWCVKYRCKILTTLIENKLVEILSMIVDCENFQIFECNTDKRPHSSSNKLFTTTLYSKHYLKTKRSIVKITCERIWNSVKKETMGQTFVESKLFCSNRIRKYRRTN